jgi:hypothetical protein
MIAQHLVDESNFSCVKMHFLSHICYHICQRGKLLNASSELPEGAMINLEQDYRESCFHEPTSRSMRIPAQPELFMYQELNDVTPKQHPDNKLPSTIMLIKCMMINP